MAQEDVSANPLPTERPDGWFRRDTLPSLLEVSARAAASLVVTSYVVGFAIVNYYLYALGFGSLEFARTRYIVTGIAFLIYLTSIALPLVGLMAKIRAETSYERRVFAALNYSWLAYIYLSLMWNIVSWFAVLQGRSPMELLTRQSGVDSKFSITTSFIRHFWITGKALALLAIGLYLLYLLLLAAIHLFGKERQKPMPSWLPVGALSRSKLISATKVILGLMILLSIPGTLQDYWGAMSGARINVFVPFFGTSSFGNTPVGATFAVFLLGMCMITAKMVSVSFGDSGRLRVDRDMYSLANALLFATVCIAVYVVIVFPRLPQSFGGGAPVQVTLRSTDARLAQAVPLGGRQTYLFDRTTTSMLLLAVSAPSGEWSLVELRSDLVDTVEYTFGTSSFNAGAFFPVLPRHPLR